MRSLQSVRRCASWFARGFFLFACASKNTDHRVVAFVAGVFIQLFVDGVKAQLAAPGMRIQRGIFDGEFVKYLGLRVARESLGHFRGLGQISGMSEARV